MFYTVIDMAGDVAILLLFILGLIWVWYRIRTAREEMFVEREKKEWAHENKLAAQEARQRANKTNS